MASIARTGYSNLTSTPFDFMSLLIGVIFASTSDSK